MQASSRRGIIVHSNYNIAGRCTLAVSIHHLLLWYISVLLYDDVRHQIRLEHVPLITPLSLKNDLRLILGSNEKN